MRENYTLTRLYVNAVLAEGESVTLSKAQSHYLGNVLRKGKGDSVRLFNGESGEWRADISVVSKRAATLTVKEQLREAASCPDITLCFAPVRKHRTTFIIEKATELGARYLQPVITARTQFPKFNVEKARLQAIEAAEQTERLDIPAIRTPLKLDVMLNDWGASRRLIFADETGGAKPALEMLQSVNGPTAIIIGPEGGFTPQERELLQAKDFVVPVSLGPRILRADTAALAILTLWQAVQGDWG
ncbi:16S rRNA (uracil(1498)-N(3))-methyltransferase [Hellea balneolensis]|uniref:16S rRNA (uracil(1498)-N(3))-methyltransferase n=1 Tax=Hellea balneolensis TaxID=287478 RepID=UPI000400F52D|nr:16S rRNA (uracil(1498)-N(3))-methyltransferase [Hellea balneolensis]